MAKDKATSTDNIMDLIFQKKNYLKVKQNKVYYKELYKMEDNETNRNK